MIRINIITQLLGFFILAAMVNYLKTYALLSLFAILFLFILFNNIAQFLRTIKRFKWFLIVMWIIFAFNTPGEHVNTWPFSISPTHEGIKAGFTQMLRIVVMLAALFLIMASNTKQQLISGFYFIFSPLKYLGLEVERFAARLWLTLHYVELQREEKVSGHYFDRLKKMTALKSNSVHDDVSIVFQLPNFAVIDYVVIVLLVVFSLYQAIA